MSTPKLAHTAKQSRLKCNRVLASVRAKKPTQVVIWYATESGHVGVEISEGTERTKVIGALTIAAQELWSGDG